MKALFLGAKAMPLLPLQGAVNAEYLDDAVGTC